MVSSSTSFEENASLASLIAFGATFGLAHVLSGPDHVIALAVIASSSSSTTTDDDDVAAASGKSSSPISNSDDHREEEEEEEEKEEATTARADDECDEERGRTSLSVSLKDDDGKRRTSNNNNNNNLRRRRRRENVLLGFSWALGHSVGLSFLVCAFFLMKRELNVNAIGDVGDKIVGFTMIAVALAAARGAKKFREREKAEKEHVRDDTAEGEGEEKAHAGDEVVLEIDPTVFGARVVTSGSKEHEEMHARREPHVHQSSKRGGCERREEEEEDEDDFRGEKASAVVIVADEGEPKREENDHQKSISKNSLCFDDDDDDDDATKTTAAAEKKKKDSSTGDKAKKSAFLVGLVHGVSGVSGILGVLPGVVLNSSSKSAAFIVSFLLCSTFAMTLSSVLFGETLRKAAALAGAGRRKKLDAANLVVFWVNVFFAVGAFACGCAWLYLSFSGKGVDV